jgi:hypothetical protein
MGLRCSAGDQSWAVVATGPDQDHDAAVGNSEADQPLFAVGNAIVLSGEHGTVEGRRAVRQVDSMLAQIRPALGGIMTHCAPAYMH